MWIKNSSILVGYRNRNIRTSSFYGISSGCDKSDSDESSLIICESLNNICPCEMNVRWCAEGHNRCIEYRTNSSIHQFESFPGSSYDTTRTIDGKSANYYSITNMCTPGTFDIQLRWNSGHSPYPEISKITVIVFGTRVRDNEKISCACEDPTESSWETVARVTVLSDRSFVVERIRGSESENPEQSDSESIEEDDIQ